MSGVRLTTAAAFASSFKKGLSGFTLKRGDPKAPLIFRLEPHDLYAHVSQASPALSVRLAGLLGYLIPSLLFVTATLLLEHLLPLSVIFSDIWTRGMSLSQAMLLGAIVFETTRVFRSTFPYGTRYVLITALIVIVLTLDAWPNSAILLVCAFYAGAHRAVDLYIMRRLDQTRKLQLEPLSLMVSLALILVAAWGTPWTALALLGDIWTDDVLSGQLARSCLWAALGPSVLPVLLLHLAYSVAQLEGLLAVLGAMLVVFSLLGNDARGRLPKKEIAGRLWISAAFHAGFLPALGLLSLAAVATWPESILWEGLFFWVMLLGFALRARGWNLKILISLAWAVLCVQEIVERLVK